MIGGANRTHIDHFDMDAAVDSTNDMFGGFSGAGSDVIAL